MQTYQSFILAEIELSSVVIVIGLVAVFCLIFVAAWRSSTASIDHNDFMSRFKAYYPEAEIVEVFHCAVVVKRGSKFFRIAENAESKFYEEPFQPFTETTVALS